MNRLEETFGSSRLPEIILRAEGLFFFDGVLMKRGAEHYESELFQFLASKQLEYIEAIKSR